MGKITNPTIDNCTLSSVFAPHLMKAFTRNVGIRVRVNSRVRIRLGLWLVIAFMRCGAETEETQK